MVRRPRDPGFSSPSEEPIEADAEPTDERGLFAFADSFPQKNSKKPPAKTEPPQPEPHYHGHRERLRTKFRELGDTALADYELLELLLFRLIPRRDTKPVAKALLERFGTLAGVFGAPLHLLEEVNGIGEAVAADIKLVSAIAHRTLKSEIKGKTVLGSWKSVIDYCHQAMAYETNEQFRILFLDKRNQLIADEIQQRGTVDHTPVYPREVIKRALHEESAVVLVFHREPATRRRGAMVACSARSRRHSPGNNSVRTIAFPARGLLSDDGGWPTYCPDKRKSRRTSFVQRD